MNPKNIKIIPIKVSNYSELFYDFDYNKLENRKLRDDIDTFILEEFKNIRYHTKINLKLEVNIPESEYSLEKEKSSLRAINKYYKSKIDFDNKMKKLAVARITSYIITSVLLSILWYYVNTKRGDIFLSTILDTAATVVLWQVMSVIFIESKNYKLNSQVNKILGNIEVIFKYTN